MRWGGLSFWNGAQSWTYWVGLLMDKSSTSQYPRILQCFLRANCCRISFTTSRANKNPGTQRESCEPNHELYKRMIASGNEVGVVVEGTADVLTAETTFFGILPWHERSPSGSPKRRRVHKFQLANMWQCRQTVLLGYCYQDWVSNIQYTIWMLGSWSTYTKLYSNSDGFMQRDASILQMLHKACNDANPMGVSDPLPLVLRA